MVELNSYTILSGATQCNSKRRQATVQSKAQGSSKYATKTSTRMVYDTPMHSARMQHGCLRNDIGARRCFSHKVRSQGTLIGKGQR